jgi:hypothetical protein
MFSCECILSVEQKLEADVAAAHGALDPATAEEIENRASFRKQVATCMSLMNDMRAQIGEQVDAYETQIADLKRRLLVRCHNLRAANDY